MSRRPRSRASDEAGRPREGTAVHAKGKERSEQILDAAAAILVEEGHAQLSMRKVAERAGVRLGHVQYYYPSRRELVAAALDRYLAAAAARVDAGMAEAGADPRERLRAAVEGILEDQVDPAHCRFFVELWALAAQDDDIAAAMRAFYTGYRRRVAAALLALIPGLTARRAHRRAALLVALFEGVSLFRGRAGASTPGLLTEVRALVPELVEMLA